MRWRHITVREVNRHLAVVVSELQAKHGNVTSDEFESELVAITGIGWKQVKNYRNHPAPDQVLAANSKIKAFIYNGRRKALYQTLRSKRVIATACAMVLVITGSYQFGIKRFTQTQPMAPLPAVEVLDVAPGVSKTTYKPVLKFTVPGVAASLQLGKFTRQLRALKWDEYYSQSEGYRRLDFHEAKGTPPEYFLMRLSYNLDTEDVIAIEIQCVAADIIDSLKKQIEEQTRSGFTLDQKKRNWEGQSEFISLSTIFDIYGRGPPYDRFVLTLTAKDH